MVPGIGDTKDKHITEGVKMAGGAEDALDDDGRSALDYARARQQVLREPFHQQIISTCAITQ